MKKFLTVLLVIAVMFTFSFGSAFAMTTVTKNNLTHYEKGDFSYASTDFTANSGTTKGGIGVTDIELATVAYTLNANVKALAKNGTYTYITDAPANGGTPAYGPTGTTKNDIFHGARLKNVQGLVAATLETVKTAKNSYAIHTALVALDRKVYEEKSQADLVNDLKTTTGTTKELKIDNLVTADGGYILPGYGRVTVATATKHFYEGESTTTAKDEIIAGTITNTAYGPLLGWFFDNGYETYEQITSTAAARKFQDSLVKISTDATATIYNGTGTSSSNPKGNFTDEGYVLYQQAKGLKRAVALANVIDMDASYNAVKVYRDFEAANYADDTYQSNNDAYNDDDLLKAALGYYGGMNFKKYNDIKKMSQAEVLAAKADVVALAEAIVAFEGKFEKKYAELDLYGEGKTYDLTRELGYIEVAGDDALVDAKLALNVSLPKDLKAADKAAFDAYENAYKAYKAEFDKAIYEGVDNMDLSEDTEAFLLAGARNFDVNVKEEAKDTAKLQAYLNNATLKVTTSALGNNKIRVQARFDAETYKEVVAALDANDYTISYQFYHKTAKADTYKAAKEKDRNYITYTKKSLKKGTKYKFQCAVIVKDAKGNVVATKDYKASTVGSRICR